jgi:glycosyltransferase involved in cell wall biosynthesis
MTTIKYIGFDEASGYSIAARTMASALEKEGARVSWVSVGRGASAYKPASIPQATTGYRNVIVHATPEYYPSWLEFERAQGSGPKKVWGYTAWETDKIPAHWPELLNLMDGIIVPCNWNRDIFRKCGVTPRIEVAPHVAQFEGRRPEAEPARSLKSLRERLRGKFVFYYIGAWSERKAPWFALQAFLSEFGPDEPAAFVLKTGKFDLTDIKRSWKRLWRLTATRAVVASERIVGSAENSPEVIHLDHEMSDEDIAWLHKTGDCFVSLTRGEGWGMGSYEAAWWGKPVIITGFGGQLDYLPADLSYHVNYTLQPVRGGRGWESYTADQLWAEPDAAHARLLMRRVFEAGKEARARGARLKEYVGRNFNASVIARRCLAFMEPG